MVNARLDDACPQSRQASKYRPPSIDSRPQAGCHSDQWNPGLCNQQQSFEGNNISRGVKTLTPYSLVLWAMQPLFIRLSLKLVKLLFTYVISTCICLIRCFWQSSLLVIVLVTWANDVAIALSLAVVTCMSSRRHEATHYETYMLY